MENLSPLSSPSMSSTSPQSQVSPLSLSVATSPTSALRTPTSVMRRLSKGALDRISRKNSKSPTHGPLTRRQSIGSASEESIPFQDLPPEVPQSLRSGVPFLRITRKKRIQYPFSIDTDRGIITWDSKNKTKAKTTIVIDNIKEIRVSEDARNYREEFKISSEHEDLWITIIYVTESQKLKALHIIALSKDSFHEFVGTLQRLLKYRSDIMSSLAIPGDRFVTVHWPTYVTREEGEEYLSFEGVERLARRLHVNCSKKYLREIFAAADVDHSGFLDFSEFRNFVKMLKHRSEIVTLFQDTIRKFGPKGENGNEEIQPMVMTVDVLKNFISNVQLQEMDDSTVDKIYYKFTDEYDNFTSDSFSDYLMSSYNPVIQETPEDLTRPLNEYYISSSHNTYLLGRQFVGESSVEAYIRVLQRGCRCIELDCWDGDNNIPVISHGRTFTSEVSFADVVSAIHKYAFISTPYPLILSLEIHCNSDQQQKMSEVMKSVFGDTLVTAPIINNSLTLPSPEDLKHRILVKVKASEEIDRDTFADFGSTSESTTSTETSLSEDADSVKEVTRKRTKKAASSKIVRPLGELGVYVRGLKYRNFALPESRSLTHCFSFGERSYNSICRDDDKLAQLEKHNQRYLMRVYPSGFRFTSSNYDPLICWKRGVQMAALNWQTYDVGLQMNDAMFGCGERSGYVLKPTMLRSIYARHISSLSPRRIKVTIGVISAQQLPRPKDTKTDDSFDPYIEVEILCPNSPPKRVRSKIVRNNGFNPCWNESWSVILADQLRDLVFLRILVYANDGPPFATYCARLCKMHQGYRHIPLFDLQGEQYIFSTLFIKMFMDELL
ncbi:PLC-like phosphodiesterase [Dipodascopsis uninucleata]